LLLTMTAKAAAGRDVPVPLSIGPVSEGAARPVVPHITSGYTENQRYRPLGINAYGFNPYTATEEEGNTEHGNDERIRVEEVRRGPRILFDVVAAVARPKLSVR
jgi:acetylornithine deacetylase/succinyl-diaminopimelate desuccinylase-like protein